jgi:hypothetical protein
MCQLDAYDDEMEARLAALDNGPSMSSYSAAQPEIGLGMSSYSATQPEIGLDKDMDDLAALMDCSYTPPAQDLSKTAAAINTSETTKKISEATTEATKAESQLESKQPAESTDKLADSEEKPVFEEESKEVTKSESDKSSDEPIQESTPIDFSNIMLNPMPTLDKKKKSKDEIKPVSIRTVAPYSEIVAA